MSRDAVTTTSRRRRRHGTIDAAALGTAAALLVLCVLHECCCNPHKKRSKSGGGADDTAEDIGIKINISGGANPKDSKLGVPGGGKGAVLFVNGTVEISGFIGISMMRSLFPCYSWWEPLAR